MIGGVIGEPQVGFPITLDLHDFCTDSLKKRLEGPRALVKEERNKEAAQAQESKEPAEVGAAPSAPASAATSEANPKQEVLFQSIYVLGVFSFLSATGSHLVMPNVIMWTLCFCSRHSFMWFPGSLFPSVVSNFSYIYTDKHMDIIMYIMYIVRFPLFFFSVPILRFRVDLFLSLMV